MYINDKMRTEWNDRAATKAGAKAAILDRYDGPDEAFYESGYRHVEDMLLALSEVGVDYSKWSVVLEIGCGIARCTIPLSEMFESVWATDISGNMIALAPKRDNILYVITGSLEGMPEIFDGVASHIVFQHMTKDAFYKYLDEIYDVLVSGGVFISQLHETSEPIEQGDSTILVRGYTKDELASRIDPAKWETLGLLHPAGKSEIWKWLILGKK